jgi:hypothetical protein
MIRFLKKGIPVDQDIDGQDTEGRAGEPLGRPPFKQSRRRVPDPYPALPLDTEKVLRNIRSWPHPKGSEARPSVSITIPPMEEKMSEGKTKFGLDMPKDIMI